MHRSSLTPPPKYSLHCVHDNCLHKKHIFGCIGIKLRKHSMLTCLRIYTKKLTMLTKVTCTTRCLRGLQFYSPRSKLAMFTWHASLIMKNYIEKVEAWVLPPLYPTFPRPLLYIAYIAYIMISYVISTISHWKIWFSEKHARLYVQMKSWKWSSMHLTILALSCQKYVYSLVIKIYYIGMYM